MSIQNFGVALGQVKDPQVRAALLGLDAKLREVSVKLGNALETDEGPGLMRFRRPILIPELSEDPTIQSSYGRVGELRRVRQRVFIKQGIDDTDTDWDEIPLASSGGANPTGTIGLAPVNGVATTWMRSDAAPALSQNIAPAWEQPHRFKLGLTLDEQAAPSTPAANQLALYAKDSGGVSNLYYKSDDGVEHHLSQLDLAADYDWTGHHKITVAAGGAPNLHLVRPASTASGDPQLRIAYNGTNYSDLTEWQNELAFSGVGDYYETNVYSYAFSGDPAGGAWVGIDAGPYRGFTASDNASLKRSLILRRGGSEVLDVYHYVAPNSSAYSGQTISAYEGTLSLLGTGSTYDPGGATPRPDVRIAFGTHNTGTPTSPTIYGFVAGPNCEYDQGGSGFYVVSGGTAYNVLDTRGSNANITWGGTHTFNAQLTVNADLNLGSDGDITSNRADGGTGSYAVKIRGNPSYPYTAADDRYTLLIDDHAGNHLFFLTTAGNVSLGGGGFVTGGAGVSQFATYGNFISKAWTILDGSTKYGMGMNATIDAQTVAGASAVGAQFIVQGGSTTVNMNTMQGATFDVYATPTGTTLSMLRGGKITTNATSTGVGTRTITAIEGLNISHAAGGTNYVSTFLRGIKIDNASALGSGSSIGYQMGIEIDESTRGTSGNFSIVFNQSSTDYKALALRDANAWINSRNSGELDLNASSEIQLRVVGAAHLTVTTNLLTLKDELNIALNTGTGTKIATATGQKLAFWNKTPNIQPTNAITAATFVANTSGIVDDSATFGGYTIGQIAAALIRIGLLA